MGDIGENYDPPARPLRNIGGYPSLAPSFGATPRRLPSREAELRRQIAHNQAKLAKLEEERLRRQERFGEEPPVGSVITFTKVFDSGPRGTYSYAALRTGDERVVGGGWFLTGRGGSQPRPWEWLCEFIGDAPFRIIPADRAQPPKAWQIHPDGSQTEFFPQFASLSAFGADLARAARKTGIVVSATPKVEQSATDRALDALRPFLVGREANGGLWQVLDDRKTGHVDVGTGERLDLIKTYPADEDGERRARQSVRDRNRAYRDAVRRLDEEPPIGSRVASVENRNRWARRQADGWMRYHGATVQAARLSWNSVKVALGAIRPGTPQSSELINEKTD